VARALARYALPLALACSLPSSICLARLPDASAARARDGHYALRAKLVVAGRDVRLYDYHFAALDFDIGHSDCLSALFQDESLRNRGRAVNGRTVHLLVRLCDYFAQAAADPIGMTVSNMQNACGGRYYAIIESIGR
jgi:hypothetical protein